MTPKIGRMKLWLPLLLSLSLLACGVGETEAPGDGRVAPAHIGGKADLPSWLVDSGKSLSCTGKTPGAFSGYDSAHLYALSAPTTDTDFTLAFSGGHSASAGAGLAVFEAASGKLVKTDQVTDSASLSLKFKGAAGKAYKVGAFSVQWQATGSYSLTLSCQANKAPTPTPASGFKVAAVQYGSGQAAAVSASCGGSATPNICALSTLTSQAASAGAKLVVLPEYALGGDQKYYEAAPTVGTTPSTAGSLLATFSALARKHGVYLTFDMSTATGSKSGGYKYQNTVIALDPAGKAVAVHHKFNLFGSETKRLTPGDSVTTFTTPAGKVGLLICADIYGSSTLLSRLVKDLGARVVAISSYWTVSGATNWYKKYTAKYGVYAVVGNTTHSPGQGGGVYDPKGKAMAEKISTTPSVVYATIP